MRPRGHPGRLWTETRISEWVGREFRNWRMIVKDFTMNSTEEKIRLAVGSAAAAAAIFAPLSYKWKGVLTGVAASAILTAVYGVSPMRRLLG